MFKNICYILLSSIIISCSFDPSKYGVVKTYGDNKSFIFKVSDEYASKYQDSSTDSKNPILSKAESKLLTALLKQENLCSKDSIYPSFVITSKQEKIYDITYTKLIEENYNVKSVTPLTYYGSCR